MTDLYSLYKSWRNKIAELDRRESLYVIWAYSQAISASSFTMPRDISVPPQLVGMKGSALTLWELELIAGEIVLNAGECSRRKRSLMKGTDLVDIVTGLRALENEIYGANEGAADVLIEIWRISHRQFTWQQKRMTAAELTRYYLIYDDADIDRICMRLLGLSVYDVFLIGMLFLGVYLTHPRQRYPVICEVPGITPDKIDRWLGFAATDVMTLRSELHRTHKVDESYAYRYSALRQHPIISQQHSGEAELVSPIPILVQWRFTVGLYYALMADDDFANALGKSFENVCGQILERALPAHSFIVTSQKHYGTKQKPKRTPDWIVEDKDNGLLLIECKALRATMTAKEALMDLAALEKNFERLAEGVVQIYERITEYKQGLWPLKYVKEKMLFPIIVTLEDWFLFGPRVAKLLDDKVVAGLKKAGIDPALTDEAPFAVISVNDLEKLAQVIAHTKSVFDVVGAKLLDDERRTGAWHGYLVDCAKRYPIHATVFEEEFDALFKDTLQHA